MKMEFLSDLEIVFVCTILAFGVGCITYLTCLALELNSSVHQPFRISTFPCYISAGLVILQALH